MSQPKRSRVRAKAVCTIKLRGLNRPVIILSPRANSNILSAITSCLGTLRERSTPPAMAPDLKARLEARVPDGDAPHVMHQRWESLLFLHWCYEPAQIQETLPAGLTVDTFQGEAYLGIVPFFMRNVRPRVVPSLPWFSSFQELNVRTYVYDRDGRPGIWFYSLDCNQSLATWGARALFGLPYFRAKMTAKRNTWVNYSSTRAGSDECARFRYRGLGDASETEPGSREFFLLERYYLFSLHRPLGALLRVQVSHTPYRYRAAEVEHLSTIPALLDGFSSLAPAPDHTCLVDGFDVKVYAPKTVAER